MSTTYSRGVDVSQFQNTIDWKRAKNSGIDFVIPRTGYGFSTEDKIFKATVKNAIKNGVDIPAVYHFSYACSAGDAKIEAEFAVSLCKKYELPKTTIIFYDFEYESANYYEEQRGKGKSIPKLTPALLQTITEAFCERVKELGFQTGVYFNQDYYVNWYQKGKTFKNDYFTWLADLEGEPNYPCDFHQYSHTGRVTGITTAVDLDYALFNYRKTDKPVEEEKPILKSNSEIAKEVIQGLWGNGQERKDKLTAAGYNYDDVQALVNAALPVAKPKKKVTDAVVDAVIRGDYGNGDERRSKLEAEGYVYKEVQDAVNKKLSNTKPQEKVSSKVSPAQSQDNSLTGTYSVGASALNLRYIPGLLTESNVVKILYKDEVVQCWGYYTQKNNSKWLLVQQGSLTGFVDSRYLKKM
jgi:GH25 family lysozyme M1 (1,4-beta-N-acetylmuramidase)